MRRKFRAGVVLGLVVLALLVGGLAVSLTRPLSVPVAARAPVVPSFPASEPQSPPRAPREVPRLRTFAGTAVDGDVQLDAAGRVRPTPELKAMFNYFLAALGEVDRAGVEAQLRAYLAERGFPPAVVAEVLELFEGYQRYREAAAALPRVADPGDPAALRQALAQRDQLRRTVLGVVVADGFFAEEEAYDRYILERLAVTRDRTLAPAEKEQRLALLRASLAPEVAAREAELYRMARLSQQTEALRGQGAPPEAIRELRLQRVGPEATARLEQLDRERAQWRERVEAYRHAREAILRTPGLSAEERRRAVATLIRERFTPTEALRLAAIEQTERPR